MTHPDRVLAQKVLDEAAKHFEGGFQKIMAPEPAAYVSIDQFRAAKPMAEPPINTALMFDRITSEPLVPLPEGRFKNTLYTTFQAAIDAWSENMTVYLSGHQKAETLFWRCKPEIGYDVDFEHDRAGWLVYSRLAVQ